MAIVTSGAGNHITDPVVQRMSEVINHEDSHHILQLIDLGRMEMLRQDIALFQYQQKAPPENVKIWLQLLHNSLAEAKRLLHRSGSRQNCLDSVARNPRRLSEQVREWKAFFNHLVQGFESDLFQHIVLSRNAINSHVAVSPITELLNDVINKEGERQILQADLRGMESLVLKLLQFLSLSHLPIHDLPQEIGHLSNLQFLDLSGCEGLNSLPSQIGELRNLKHFNLTGCDSLKMIPREMSELTSLSRLQLNSFHTALSVEMEAPASIWSLKGLKSLTELEVWIEYTRQQDGKRSRIKDGIMGIWSEMRHLKLCYNNSDQEDLLPEDMQNMKKLQSFMLNRYGGLISLPNCKFEHLESVCLSECDGITALSPLEQLPNLKLLKLEWCRNLRKLGIGSPSGYVSLQKLVLKRLNSLESLGGASWQRGVWDERTLPQLRVLKMVQCPSLKRFPRGMEKLPNLCALIYQPWHPHSAMEWWESIMWEDENMKVKLQQIFIARGPKH